MGSTVLNEILMNWSAYELDDSIYVLADGELSLDTAVDVVPLDPPRKAPRGAKYLLGIEQIRDVVEGLEAQLGRAATPAERLRAVIHYAKNDAFIDPKDAVHG